jgi:hypothetical protein
MFLFCSRDNEPCTEAMSLIEMTTPVEVLSPSHPRDGSLRLFLNPFGSRRWKQDARRSQAQLRGHRRANALLELRNRDAAQNPRDSIPDNCCYVASSVS